MSQSSSPTPSIGSVCAASIPSTRGTDRSTLSSRLPTPSSVRKLRAIPGGGRGVCNDLEVFSCNTPGLGYYSPVSHTVHARMRLFLESQVVPSDLEAPFASTTRSAAEDRINEPTVPIMLKFFPEVPGRPSFLKRDWARNQATSKANMVLKPDPGERPSLHAYSRYFVSICPFPTNYSLSSAWGFVFNGSMKPKSPRRDLDLSLHPPI